MAARDAGEVRMGVPMGVRRTSTTARTETVGAQASCSVTFTLTSEENRATVVSLGRLRQGGTTPRSSSTAGAGDVQVQRPVKRLRPARKETALVITGAEAAVGS